VLDNFARACCARWKPRQAGDLPFELPRASIPPVMSGLKAAVIRCGEQHPVTGTVKVAVKVAPDGSVADASVKAAPDEALGACVAGVVRKASFAQSEQGGSFTYPFVF